MTTSNEKKASQAATTDGSHNIIVQAAGDGISVNIGLPYLSLIPPRQRLPRTRNEIDLLNPYLRAITLVGREADMQSLRDWLHSPRPIAIRTLTGRAGAGKTRAAIELIESVNAGNSGTWWAGFVSGREMRRFAAQQNLAAWNWNRPTLIVVDYAGSLIEPLRDWLRDLAQGAARADGQPLRLLLLEREAAAGEGWLQSLCLGGHSEAGVPELFDPLEPKRLDRLDTVAKRRAVLEKMLEAGALLAERKPPGLPAAGENSRLDRQLENPVWEDPLYLMMAALLSRQSDLVEVLELPRTELALRLVEHEIKRLTEGAPSPAAGRLLIHLAAFAALGNGLSHEQALEVAEEESRTLKLEYPGGAGRAGGSGARSPAGTRSRPCSGCAGHSGRGARVAGAGTMFRRAAGRRHPPRGPTPRTSRGGVRGPHRAGLCPGWPGRTVELAGGFDQSGAGG